MLFKERVSKRKLFCFADDIVLIARNFGIVAETYIRIKTEARLVGLEMNGAENKCKRMGSKDDNPHFPLSVIVDGDELEAVNEFMYLGSLMTVDNEASKEIHRRIPAGNRAFFGLRRILRSNRECS